MYYLCLNMFNLAGRYIVMYFLEENILPTSLNLFCFGYMVIQRLCSQCCAHVRWDCEGGGGGKYHWKT